MVRNVLVTMKINERCCALQVTSVSHCKTEAKDDSNHEHDNITYLGSSDSTCQHENQFEQYWRDDSERIGLN